MARRRRTELSSQAQAAAMIRKNLKAAFPHTKFKVTSDSFAGGDSVDISWTDGPTRKQVEAIANRHEYGSFDGMQDLYEYTNVRDDIPQSKYVQCQRGYSVAATVAVIETINRRFGPHLTYEVKHSDYSGDYVHYDCDYTQRDGQFCRDKVYRDLNDTSFVCPSCTHATEYGDTFCGECGANLADVAAIAEAESIIFAAR